MTQNKIMTKITSLMTAAGLITPLIAAFGLTASAEGNTNTPSSVTAPVVAELFTSQSCSSCPSAERLFNSLADDENVIVIQWHVDYWDNLVHGRAGNWKDPYSKAAYTDRQREYNYALRGTGSVYTPQAVIGGIMETTGSRKRGVNKMISLAPAPSAQVDFEQLDNSYRIRVSGLDADVAADAETVFIKLLKEEATDIQGGENKGRSTQSRNVAVDTMLLGEWTGPTRLYSAPMLPSSDYTCAVLVQEKSKGRILGASYCPG